ncbi:MAG: PDZ domain-containing protein, partial [Marinobacter sp.]
PLTPENARAAGVESGVLVTGVERGAALQAGIRNRDIITEINRKPVGSLKAFREVVKNLPKGQAVSVRVVRQGRPIYLVMRP